MTSAHTIRKEINLCLDTYESLVRALPDEEARSRFIGSDIWNAMVRHLHSLGKKYQLPPTQPDAPSWIQVAVYGQDKLNAPVNIAWMPGTDVVVVTEHNLPIVRFFKNKRQLQIIQSDKLCAARLWPDKTGIWIASDAGREIAHVNQELTTTTKLNLEKSLPDRDEALHMMHFAQHGKRLYFIMQDRHALRRNVYSVDLNAPEKPAEKHRMDVLLWPRQFIEHAGKLCLTDHWFPLLESFETSGFRETTRTVYSHESRGACSNGENLIFGTPNGLITCNKNGEPLSSVILSDNTAHGVSIHSLSPRIGDNGCLAALDVYDPKIRIFSANNQK
ncbi:MAG: hypothetical protein JEY79_05815 [Pseudodesulfovibrio sp.]|nr:hypothetical protein [Pseudodesulfovibrio sp.]